MLRFSNVNDDLRPSRTRDVLSKFLHRVMFAIIATFTAVAFASSAQATTYYVSNSGSDSNNGTSTSTPWKTAAKVNTFVFQHGDQVLFLRGNIWYESLNPTGGDGAAGSPITFADYGSGNKPEFCGSDTIPNSGWTLEANQTTVWERTFSSSGDGGIYVNHVGLTAADPGANQTVEAIPSSFAWSGTTLKINVPTDPNTDGNLYTVSDRSDAICNGNPTTFNLHNHLVFTNLQVVETSYAFDNNDGYGVRIQNGTDVVINNVDSIRCGKHNFGVINSTQITLNGCTASYPLPNQDNWGGYSAYVSYGDNSTGLSNQTSVYNNCSGDHMEDTYHNSPYVDTGYEFFTTHGSNVGSVQLNNCDAYSSSAGGPGAHWTISNSDSQQAGHPATIVIKGGFIQNNQLYMQGTGLLVDGLTMEGPGNTSSNDATATIDMESSSSTIQNVLMYNLNVGTWLYSAAIQDNGSNNVIRFNTIVNNPNSYDASVVNHSQSESLFGNIFVNPGTAVQGNTPASSGYNLTYTTATTSVFVNPGSYNYALASGSPAIHEVPLSVAYPPTDITNTARPDGSSNDAGAYQYAIASPPVITSPTTATGTVGTAFSYQITATNSPASYSETGTLPGGVTLNGSSGLISGTPTASGSFPVTIKATNSAGTGPQGLTITISLPAKPVITSPTTATGNVGSAFSYQITATNNPTSYSESGTLPASLTFSSTTGKITGTPSATGTTTVTIGAINAGGTGTASLAITINSAVPVITSSGTATGTQGAAFSYQITATNSPTGYSETGTLPGGVTLNGTSGLISGTPTNSGSFPVTIKATNSGGTGSKGLTITINPPAPVITSPSTASGTTGTAFSYQITATNSPTNYSETGTLPGGVTLNGTSGLISGTPTASGSFPITIKATNVTGTGSGPLTITITASSSHLTGSLGTDSGTINLTTEGTTDWGHWGSEGSGNWDHKSGGSALGWNPGATVFTYGSDPVSFLWTDGGQNWNGQAQATGFYYNGNGTTGFSITAPADLTTRTLKFYVGSMGGTGTLTASLSDGSSPNYVNSSLAANGEGVYTLVYSAASAGQTLTVSWIDASGGRLTVQSASLH